MSLSPFARRLAGAAAAVCCIGSAFAQNIPVPRYEDDTKPEITVPLPAFPKPENLLRFPTNWTGNQVFIDTASLVFGDGETLSYTLLVRSSGGAENLSFESLRCISGERQVLAYGRRDGTWSPARSGKWIGITDGGINRYYYEFWKDVFCSGKTLEPRRAVIDNIRRGGREHPFDMPSD